MPNTKNQIFRIRIIDDLLSRKKYVKTKQIVDAVGFNLMEEVSAKTIQNDIRDMKLDTRLNLNAPIEYNNSRKAYYYSDENYTIKNFSLRPEEITALQFYAECLQVFSGYKLFDSFTSGIKKVIEGVEVRRRIKPSTNPKTIIQTDSLVTPHGQEYMEDLVYAIDNRYKIRITYHPYENDDAYSRDLLPVFLKEYRNRWYIIAIRLDNNELRTYSLDRIKNLQVTDVIKTQDIDFDPQKYFRHAFGITAPDGPVETVVLRFNKQEGAYVKSLPVHPTQQVISDTSKYTTLSIQVIISYEVYEYILSKTPGVKVISPASVANKIKLQLRKSLSLYK